MVDGVGERRRRRQPRWRERTPEELERIAALVKSAIGFDEKRGDHVEVVCMRFVEDAARRPMTARPARPAARHGRSDCAWRESALLALVGVLALLLVCGRWCGGSRSAWRRSRRRPAAARWLAALAGAALAPRCRGRRRGRCGRRACAAAAASCARTRAWSTSRRSRGRCAPPRCRRSAQLVEQHPEETLSIMRGWMAQEEQLRAEIAKTIAAQRAAEGGDPDAGARRGAVPPRCSP